MKAAERWTRGDRCLIGVAVLSLVYMSKHGSNLILDNSGVAETMVIRGAVKIARLFVISLKCATAHHSCPFEREGTKEGPCSAVISYSPVLHSPPKFHAESTDHCVVVVRAFLPRCLIVWFWCFRCNPRPWKWACRSCIHSLKPVRPRISKLSMLFVFTLRHAGRLTYLNQRRRRPWTQRRPDEHLDRSQDEGILAQGLSPQRPPKRSGYDLWIQRERGVWQYNCRRHRSCQGLAQQLDRQA